MVYGAAPCSHGTYPRVEISPESSRVDKIGLETRILAGLIFILITPSLVVDGDAYIHCSVLVVPNPHNGPTNEILTYLGRCV